MTKARKSRKARCCTKCGRKTKGHDGPCGDKCTIGDDVPIVVKEKSAGAKSAGAKSRKSVDVLSDDHSEADVSSSDDESSEDSDGSTKGQLQVLSNQVGLLTSTVSKLLSQKAVEKKLEISARPKKYVGKGGKSEASIVPVTTRTLSKDKELNCLLEAYNAGEEEFLSTFEESGTSSRKIGGRASVNSGEKPKKALYITDYLSKLDGCLSDDEESVVMTGGAQLTIKTKTKKVEPKDVSVGQWISANSRILDILSESMSAEQIACYHEYTRNVGDLLQLYTVSSVMLLDHAHRKHVHATGRAWDNVSRHLDKMFLRLKNVQGTPDEVSASSSSSVSKPEIRKSTRPCFAYNSKAGCKYGNGCRYKHKCSERGCGKDHPKWDHERFRAPASS